MERCKHRQIALDKRNKTRPHVRSGHIMPLCHWLFTVTAFSLLMKLLWIAVQINSWVWDFMYCSKWILVPVCSQGFATPRWRQQQHIWQLRERWCRHFETAKQDGLRDFRPSWGASRRPQTHQPPRYSRTVYKKNNLSPFWVAGVKPSPYCNQGRVCKLFLPHYLLCSFPPAAVWVTVLIPEGHSQAGQSQSRQSQCSVLKCRLNVGRRLCEEFLDDSTLTLFSNTDFFKSSMWPER